MDRHSENENFQLIASYNLYLLVAMAIQVNRWYLDLTQIDSTRIRFDLNSTHLLYESKYLTVIQLDLSQPNINLTHLAHLLYG